MSAIQQNSYGYQMACVTRLLLQGAALTGVLAAAGLPDVETLRKLWDPWAQAQAALFVEGLAALPPQECAKVARMLTEATP
ncbi:hypothetical protein ACFLIM_09095 [Nonomuraea sp. M3C6]|uniref:Uncharacterized protein n=1 Tax=Nonomuraea marmarensis TaxID=3351344 RepID=A0ABW7A7M1_9ACTN